MICTCMSFVLGYPSITLSSIGLVRGGTGGTQPLTLLLQVVRTNPLSILPVNDGFERYGGAHQPNHAEPSKVQFRVYISRRSSIMFLHFFT